MPELIDTPHLRRPEPSDLPGLTELCLRSKAHWGYDEAFMAACREELTLTEADLKASTLCMLESHDLALGVVQIVFHDQGDDPELEALFIEPAYLGRGYGQSLLGWAKDTARAQGCNALMVTADPGAASFYERYGGVKIGSEPSGSISERTLPRYRLPLNK